jgi:hypothetical protein
MAAANTSKSLVHIQEKFVKRAQFTLAITVPNITSGAVGGAAAITTGTVNGTASTSLAGYVKAGDTLLVQPTTSSDIIANAVPLVGTAPADGSALVAFAAVGGAVATATKTYTITVFASPF